MAVCVKLGRPKSLWVLLAVSLETYLHSKIRADSRVAYSLESHARTSLSLRI